MLRKRRPTPLMLLLIAVVTARAQSLPEAFDLRNVYGTSFVTDVKDQTAGTCWVHAVMAAIESNLLINGAWAGAGFTDQPNLAEYHLDWHNGFNPTSNTDSPGSGK